MPISELFSVIDAEFRGGSTPRYENVIRAFPEAVLAKILISTIKKSEILEIARRSPAKPNAIINILH